MAHIIVTGATGLAGSAILAECLASPAIAKVSILSRRSVDFAGANPKANVIIHSDYLSYSSTTLDQLRGATGCIWAQGKSSVGMQENEYTVLTHDWPLAAAEAMAELPEKGEKFKFVYISGEGADPTEKASQMFGRVKGRAEKNLLALTTTRPGLSVYNLRPGAIDPMGNDPRNKPFSTMGDLPIRIFGPIFKFVYPSMHTPTKSLAEISVQLAVGDGQPLARGKGVEADGWTIRNTAIRQLAGL
jgi:uncharacterized protein YbjT (DUF2867 family)